VAEAAKVITASADDNAKVIFGTVVDESLTDKIRITVVATGFGDENRFVSTASEEEPRSFFSAGKNFYGNSLAGKKKIEEEKDNDEEEKPVFTSRSVSTFSSDVAMPSSSPKKDDKKSDDDDLEIPAFIRKKMGM